MALDLPNYNPSLAGAFHDAFNKVTEDALKRRQQQLMNQYYGPEKESEINQRKATTEGQNIFNQFAPDQYKLANESAQQTNTFNSQMNPYKLQREKTLLENLPASEKARIEALKATANWRNSGGSAGGVGQKEEQYFQSLVAKDNPHIPPDKIYEASNAIREGRDHLSDGTPIKPLSPASRASFDRIIKGTTTSGVLTPLINANMAESEIKVLSDYAQRGLKPFGTTYFNMNPDQVVASFKSDPKSQKELGKFIAAQQLQYEIAQNEIKLAMGQPGVTSTNELMNLSQQGLKTSYPRLSYAAREEANRYFIEALKEALKARKKAGMGASSVLPSQSNLKNPKDMTAEEINQELASYG